MKQKENGKTKAIIYYSDIHIFSFSFTQTKRFDKQTLKT